MAVSEHIESADQSGPSMSIRSAATPGSRLRTPVSAQPRYDAANRRVGKKVDGVRVQGSCTKTPSGRSPSSTAAVRSRASSSTAARAMSPTT